MVKAIRYVKDAFINAGDGVMDFVPTVEQLRPDIFVVNEDGASDEKRHCATAWEWNTSCCHVPHRKD